MDLANYVVSLSLPAHWGNPEGDAACRALAVLKVRQRIEALVKGLVAAHPDLVGVAVTVENENEE